MVQWPGGGGGAAVFESVAIRALGLLAAAMSLAVGASAVASTGLGWRHLVARLAFAALLAWLARLAWRRPAGRDERARRRLLRLASVLADPELQREHAESSPSVGLAEAVRADWRAATRRRADLVRNASAPQLRAIDELSLALDALPDELADLSPSALQREAAWLDLQAKAQATAAALRPPGPAGA